MSDDSYQGFGDKALPFLKALGFHQSREWFNENRDLYESEVNEPRYRLVDDFAVRLKEANLPLTCSRKTSTFRINRDVRFAKDKSPFNTHVSAVITRTGNKHDNGMLYIHIKPDNCFIGVGFYQLDGTEMRAFREAMISRSEAFFGALKPLETIGYGWMEQDLLKRLPRGFETEDPKLAHALRVRSVAFQRSFGEERLKGTLLLDDLMELAQAAQPLLDFGWRIIDPIRAARKAEADSKAETKQ